MKRTGGWAASSSSGDEKTSMDFLLDHSTNGGFSWIFWMAIFQAAMDRGRKSKSTVKVLE